MYTGFEDKVIVITGSSRGLGKALAIAFAKEGAFVVVNYRANHEDAQKTYKELCKYSDNSSVFCADVTKEEDVKALYSFVKKKYGKVDVLVNNAGINSDSYVNLMSKEGWDKVINTNLTGVFLCTRYFGKIMVKNKYGKIINIASLKGQLGSEGQANYSASKAGIIGFSKSLAKELGKENVSINVVCPGYIKTDINKDNAYKTQIANEMSAMSIEHGLEDYINFTMFLASDRIKGVSGQVFNIDSRIM